jgi:hypothetical protein
VGEEGHYCKGKIVLSGNMGQLFKVLMALIWGPDLQILVSTLRTTWDIEQFGVRGSANSFFSLDLRLPACEIW